jgi:4-amino-4-deoxy-L-arabinose transferase-like glycosyltransferase
MPLRSPVVRTSVAILAILAAVAARHVGNSKQIPLYVIASTVIAIVGAAVSFPPLEPRRLSLEHGALVERRLIFAALCFILPTLIAVLIWRTEPFGSADQFVHSSSTGAAILWLIGLSAGLAVLWDRRPYGRSIVAGVRTALGRPNATRVLAILLIIIVGAVVRLWHLSSLPEGIWSDEADSAADAVRMLQGPFQPFAPGNYGHNPSLYFYAMAALIRMGGDNIETARLTSALFGIAGIVVVFALAYQIRGVVPALCAGSLMALSQWAITFSRLAMPNIPIPAVTGLGYVAFIIAMHRPRPFSFALSGILLGLSFLTYPGAYIPAVVPVLLVYVRSRSDRAFAQASRSGRLFLLLGLLAGAAPMLTTLFLDANYVLGRVHVTSLFNEYRDTPHRVLGLLDNLRSYALMFTVQGDRNGRHNLSGSPMLDPVTGVLFLLGLGICLRQWRLWQYQVLLLWLGSNLLSGILSLESEAPHGPRTLGALTPAVVIAALPVLYLYPLIQRLTVPRRTGWSAFKAITSQPKVGGTAPVVMPSAVLLSSVIAVALLMSAAALNFNQYFREQADSLLSWEAMGGQITTIARSVAQLNREGNHVYTNKAMMDDVVMHFVAPDWTPQDYNARQPLNDLPRNGRIIFVIPAQETQLVRALRAEIRNIQVVTITPMFNHAIVEAYVVSWQARDAKSSGMR